MIRRLVHSDKLCHFMDKMERQFRWMYVLRTSEFLAALLSTIGGAAKIDVICRQRSRLHYLPRFNKIGLLHKESLAQHRHLEQLSGIKHFLYEDSEDGIPILRFIYNEFTCISLTLYQATPFIVRTLTACLYKALIILIAKHKTAAQCLHTATLWLCVTRFSFKRRFL
jgi:hypothetical protein